MRVRLREPAGQTTLTLSDSATVGELYTTIAEKTSLPEHDLKYGYPPRPLMLSDYTSNTKLADLGIKLDGEQLIVSRSTDSSELPEKRQNVLQTIPKSGSQDRTMSEAPPSVTQTSSGSGFSFAGVGEAPPTSQAPPNKPLSLSRKQDKMSPSDSPELPVASHGATMVLRIMPDDNSCLFRAFNTAFLGTGMDNMHELRSVVAQYIQAHPETYSAAVLDQNVDDYCRWIQTEDAWGGSIELDILSKSFDVEICSIDVQTLRTDRYNEGRPQRCILVYSGIHYDTIALSPSDSPHTQAYAPPDFDTKVFDAVEDSLLQTAVDLCRVLQGRHYYTDTAGFSVRCNICGFTAKGEKGASKHASETGHMDFGES